MRSKRLGDVAMGEDDLRVRVDRHQRVQVPDVPRALQHPPLRRPLRVQDLELELVELVRLDHVPFEHISCVLVGREGDPERQHRHVVFEQKEVLLVRVSGHVVRNALVGDGSLVEAERELGLSAPPGDVAQWIAEPAKRVGQLPSLGHAVVRIGGQHVVEKGRAGPEEPCDDEGPLDVDIVQLRMPLGEVNDPKPVAELPVEDVASAEQAGGVELGFVETVDRRRQPLLKAVLPPVAQPGGPLRHLHDAIRVDRDHLLAEDVQLVHQ